MRLEPRPAGAAAASGISLGGGDAAAENAQQDHGEKGPHQGDFGHDYGIYAGHFGSGNHCAGPCGR